MAEEGDKDVREQSLEGEEDSLSKDGLISLEDLDKIIDEEEPGFNEKLEEVAQDQELQDAEIELFDIDTDDLASEDERVDKWVHYWSQHPRLQKLRKPIEKIKVLFEIRLRRVKNTLHMVKSDAIDFFKVGFPERLRYLKSSIVAFAGAVKGRVKEISSLSWQKKIGAALIGVLITFTLGLIYLQIQGGWLPQVEDKELYSLESRALRVIQWDTKKEMRGLFRLFPQQQFIVLIRKIVVNLTPTKRNGTPMAAFEFYIDVDSQDTAVEIKDREVELLDRVQRAIEQLSYPEIHDHDGKTKLKTTIRQAMNEVLNQGRVEKVYLKHIVTKPD